MVLLARDGQLTGRRCCATGGRGPAGDRHGKRGAFKLAYLVSHPIQYQAPLLKRLASDPAINLKVFFMSDLATGEFQDAGFGAMLRWDVPLLDGYEHEFLKTLGRGRKLSFWQPFVFGLSSALRQGFQALWVHDYAHQASLRAIGIARRLGLKVLLRSESNLISHPRSRARLVTKGRVLPRLFRWVDVFLAIGTHNVNYYLHYGVPAGRIFMMPYAVDNRFFQERANAAAQRREQLRARLGLAQERSVILFASKFQKRKRARDLIEAYVRLAAAGGREPKPYLLMIGDGEQRESLEEQARNLGGSSIRFLGFKNQTELPGYYDLCDVFVLPSEHEPWGLVVNEAMNAGKPVIVSDQVGAAPDLVRDGSNGFVVPVGDVSALADRLNRLVSDRALAARMGEESLRLVSRWNFERDAEGLKDALRYVLRDAAPDSHERAAR